MKLPPLHGFYEWVFSGFYTNTVSRITQTTGVLASWKTISCWKSKQDVTYVKAQKHPSELKYVLGGDHRAHRAWVFAARRYDCPEHSWFCLFMCLEILCNLCELMQLITSSPNSSSEAANTLGADREAFSRDIRDLSIDLGTCIWCVTTLTFNMIGAPFRACMQS